MEPESTHSCALVIYTNTSDEMDIEEIVREDPILDYYALMDTISRAKQNMFMYFQQEFEDDADALVVDDLEDSESQVYEEDDVSSALHIRGEEI